jgi:UPF0755 protein
MAWFWRGLWMTLGMGLVVAGAALWWVLRPLPMVTQTVDLSISSGSTPRMVAAQIAESGIDVSPTLMYYLFRFSGQSKLIRAGSYEIANTTNAWDLLQKLVRGEENLIAITLVEGWTLRQWRQALAKAEFLKHDTQGDTDEELMRRLGVAEVPGEGRFFPDTYMYGKGSSDVAVLRRAMKAMDTQLAQAWAQRDMGLPLQNPQEALILASIVEKETGKPSDRAMIASVFHNRLRINMPLANRPHRHLRHGGCLRRQFAPRGFANRTSLEHLCAQGLAAHTHRHAGQGRIAGHLATRHQQSAVLCGTR